ncbi:MAG: sulfite exporter TauE/SafE family protein [Thermodesulfobacteriota bacterium]|nr:sulfite exporter TauE/SafE family protein [Thermodesulfobacteriota bacterium]
MTSLVVVGLLILFVAIAMTMVGKGGANFYVVILATANIPMHEAATTAQFILFCASVAAMIVFKKNEAVSWTLALLVGTLTAFSAFAGGYFSHLFGGFSLKLVFVVMLVIAGAVMLIPVSEKQNIRENRHLGMMTIHSGRERYRVNLWIAVPVAVLTGLGSGMVGVSGGSFLVPLMVSACGVSMHTAVGTASTLIAAIALMGFAGHAIQGDFNPLWAVPLAIVAVVGGIVGGKLSLKTKPKHLKMLFAYTNWLAAFFMAINAILTKGGI